MTENELPDGKMMESSSAIGKMEVKGSKKQKLISGMFLTGVASIAMLSGFLRTLSVQRKKDPATFMQSPAVSKILHESGVALASRALMWGTVYAIGGFSAFCFLIWKLMGVESLEEFRDKIQRTMPKIPKKEQQGRSDFKTVRELVNYIIEEDEKKKGSS